MAFKVWYLAILGCLLSLLGGNYAVAEPTLFVGSAVAPPGEQGFGNMDSPATVPLAINAEVQGVRDACGLDLRLRAITPGAPQPTNSYGFCPEYINAINGPARLGYIGFDVPADAPEGALYTIEVRPIHKGLLDEDGQTIPVTIVQGVLLVRQKPMIRGDLDDNGAIQVADATLSLRLALGLDPADGPPSDQSRAYLRAAGDAYPDGQLTVADTIKILRWAVGSEPPPSAAGSG